MTRARDVAALTAEELASAAELEALGVLYRDGMNALINVTHIKAQPSD